MKTYSFSDSSRIFYIADTHFGHGGIIKHCARPFKDAGEMDAALIRNWNAAVGVNDTVFIIGDFAFKGGAAAYAKKLNGKKILIMGNHDKPDTAHAVFGETHEMCAVRHLGREIILCHYPLAEWPGYYRGTLHFFGHIHNNRGRAAEAMDGIPGAYNAGADLTGFTPREAGWFLQNKKAGG